MANGLSEQFAEQLYTVIISEALEVGGRDHRAAQINMPGYYGLSLGFTLEKKCPAHSRRTSDSGSRTFFISANICSNCLGHQQLMIAPV